MTLVRGLEERTSSDDPRRSSNRDDPALSYGHRPGSVVTTTNIAAHALLGDWIMPDGAREVATVGARQQWFCRHVAGVDFDAAVLRIDDPLDLAVVASVASEVYHYGKHPIAKRVARDAIERVIAFREQGAAWKCTDGHGVTCDLEITAWSLMATKSACAAGIPESTRDQDAAVRAWLDRIAEAPDADDSPGATALMLWCRILVEQDPAHSAPMRAEIARLAENIPSWGSGCFERDRALWLWGSYAARQMNGDDLWEPWSRALGDALTREIDAWTAEGGREPSLTELTTALLATQSPFRYPRIYGAR